MKEMLVLARKVRKPSVSSQRVLMLSEQVECTELVDLVTTEMLSSITLGNVVEEMFSGLPLCPHFLIVASLY